jgi:hypothetical protein
VEVGQWQLCSPGEEVPDEVTRWHGHGVDGEAVRWRCSGQPAVAQRRAERGSQEELLSECGRVVSADEVERWMPCGCEVVHGLQVGAKLENSVFESVLD